MSKFQRTGRGTKDCGGNENVKGEEPEKRKQIRMRKDRVQVGSRATISQTLTRRAACGTLAPCSLQLRTNSGVLNEELSQNSAL